MVAVLVWRLLLRKNATPDQQQTGDDIAALAEAVAAAMKAQQEAESGGDSVPEEKLDKDAVVTIKPGDTGGPQ